MARYAVGIDLGTTNSAIAYCDVLGGSDSPAVSRTLGVPQLQSPNVLADAVSLPSAIYLGTPDERARSELRFPDSSEDPRYGVGTIAKSRQHLHPGRVVVSAKSWLTHRAVDRTAKLLPWASDELVADEKLSPVEVSAAILRHLRETWDRKFAAFESSYRLEHQQVVVTVPASFDIDAQRLTRAAAEAAGLGKNVRLLEEPQAAFYNWLDANGSTGGLEAVVPEFRYRPITVLVVDVGGGTSDFSMFEAERSGDSDRPRISRRSVSDHILLGGDNMDLAIAQLLENKLGGEKLPFRTRQELLVESRSLKERALSGPTDSHDVLTVSIAAGGRGLFEHARSVSVSTAEILELVLDGFFPECGAEARAHRRTGGLLEWGLPYAAESGVTKHLAEFRAGAKIDAVLFNGGALKPTMIRRRLLSLIEAWQGGEPVIELETTDLDLAVSRGAAYFGGLILRGEAARASRIDSGLPRSLYLELYRANRSDPRKLVCLLPKGTPDGSRIVLEGQRFQATVGMPSRFQLFAARSRPNDSRGSVVSGDSDQFEALPAVHTSLGGEEIRGGATVDVSLETEVDELGTVRLFLAPLSGETRWELEFQTRDDDAGASMPITGVDRGTLLKAEERIHHYFGKKRPVDDEGSPKRLFKELEAIFGEGRSEWPADLNRALWKPLSIGMTRRGRSPAHEIGWLSLAGFCLRPGYGAELDPVRIDELWKCMELGLSFPREPGSRQQWWVLWRRVAGGLSNVRQERLADEADKELTSRRDLDPELIRLAGSLERISASRREHWGSLLLRLATGKNSPSSIEAALWALGRIMSRAPLYAGHDAALPAATVVSWMKGLRAAQLPAGMHRTLSATITHGCKLTGDPRRDIDEATRDEMRAFLSRLRAPAEYSRALREVEEVDDAARARMFGESLPSGIRLVGIEP